MKRQIPLLIGSAAVIATAADLTLPRIDVINSKDTISPRVPGAYTLIDQKTLSQQMPLSTQDALKGTSGVNVVETDGYGFYPRIGIRGLNPDMSKKVLLLEDGAPVQLGPFIDPAAYYSPSIERMEEIEILKGSSSLRYGPSTIGGVINYKTKTPKPGFNALLRATAGSHNYRSLLGDVSYMEQGSYVSASVLRKEGDGWRDMPFSVSDIVVKGGTLLGNNHSVSLKASHYTHESAHTYLGLTEREFNENHKQNRATNDEMFVTRLGLEFSHQWDISPNSYLRTLVYANNTTRDWWREEFRVDIDADTVTMRDFRSPRLREFTVAGLDTRLNLQHELLGLENELEVGIRPHYETMTNRRMNSAQGDVTSTTTIPNNQMREYDIREAYALALFAINDFHLNSKLTLSPGFRVETYKQEREIIRWDSKTLDIVDESSNTVFIPGFGFNYALLPEAQLFGGLHKGFSPPRVQDAIDNSGEAVDLDAEESINYEIGLRGRSGRVNYEIAGFIYDFSNQIISATQSGGASAGSQTNSGESLNRGLEAQLQVSLPYFIGYDMAWTWVPTAEFRETLLNSSGNIVQEKGKRLPYSPEQIFHNRLSFNPGDLTFGIGYSYTGSQYTDMLQTKDYSTRADGRQVGRIDSFGLWNADISYQVGNVTVNGSVKNLLDEKYIASRAPRGIFPGMGRTFLLSSTVQF